MVELGIAVKRTGETVVENVMVVEDELKTAQDCGLRKH